MAENQIPRNDWKEALIPVVVCYCVFGILGIFGNVFTINYYSSIATPSTTYLIRSLAISDLVISTTLIADCMQLLFVTTSNLKVVCQVIKWFTLSGLNTSGFIAVGIAFHRHRKICRPFKKQLPLTHKG